MKTISELVKELTRKKEYIPFQIEDFKYDKIVKNKSQDFCCGVLAFQENLRQSIIEDIKNMRESISYKQISGTCAVRVDCNFCQPISEHYKILHTINWLIEKYEITEDELK